ncbi:hypothetical protein KP509_11G059600 [Ceratopteris richardii]|uniref:PRC-barrel domain-containing protein n=1 Tax=Ceratopteris richardii TaxID=49495 RepID=A0A8T2TYK0_CERRI|nr:hypothetical protein KP509_11G059600 [Ceratopteris richardii]
MGGPAAALCSSSISLNLSSLTLSGASGRIQIRQVTDETRWRVKSLRQSLRLYLYERFSDQTPMDSGCFHSYSRKIRQNESRFPFRFRLSVNFNEIPSSTERFVQAEKAEDAVKTIENSANELQFLNMPNRVLRDSEHASDVSKTQKYTLERSVEEDYGLLKEQVEMDRRLQLARKEGPYGQGSMDAVRPLKRSNIIAKQVISQSSARIIGFVSQLWISVKLFSVVALEVRPSLLSGDVDKVFLADICQIGDVVLVNDESALENEITALDCETLVGYDVITEKGNGIGKIRDFSFDIQDGKLNFLEFDSIGFSLVPSSLISTYRLNVEDVIEVLPDYVVVKMGAESRIRRLTKGLWQLPNAGDKERNRKLVRSRLRKRSFSEGTDVVNQKGRPLPPSMRSRYFERLELEGVDARGE